VFVFVGEWTVVRVGVAGLGGPAVGVDVRSTVGVDVVPAVGVDVTFTIDVGVTVFVKCVVGDVVRFRVAVGVFFRGLGGFRGGRFPLTRPFIAAVSICSTASMRFRSADGSMGCARLVLRCRTSANPKGMRSAVKTANHCMARPGCLVFPFVIIPPIGSFGVRVLHGFEEIYCRKGLRAPMFLSRFSV
jgi:hypothetical protein